MQNILCDKCPKQADYKIAALGHDKKVFILCADHLISFCQFMVQEVIEEIIKGGEVHESN